MNVVYRNHPADGWPATIHWRKLDYPVTKVLDYYVLMDS